MRRNQTVRPPGALRADQTGATLTEYVLVIALVALGAMGAWVALGDAVAETALCAASAIGGASGSCAIAARSGRGADTAGRAIAALTADENAGASSDGSSRGAGAIGRGTAALGGATAGGSAGGATSAARLMASMDGSELEHERVAPRPWDGLRGDDLREALERAAGRGGLGDRSFAAGLDRLDPDDVDDVLQALARRDSLSDEDMVAILARLDDCGENIADVLRALAARDGLSAPAVASILAAIPAHEITRGDAADIAETLIEHDNVPSRLERQIERIAGLDDGCDLLFAPTSCDLGSPIHRIDGLGETLEEHVARERKERIEEEIRRAEEQARRTEEQAREQARRAEEAARQTAEAERARFAAGALNPAGVDPGLWSVDLLRLLGAPVTAENVRAISAWQQAEGTSSRFNPLATTQWLASSSNANSVGVKNYASYEDGLNATVITLDNGYYPDILAALRSGTDAMAVANAVAASPWGTHEGVIRVLQSQ